MAALDAVRSIEADRTRRMILRYSLSVSVLLAAFCATSHATTFDDAVKICASVYRDMQDPRDDGDASIKVPGRINVVFKRSNYSMLCSVGIESGEIEQAGGPGFMLNKHQIAQAMARRKARDEEVARILAGDHSDFVRKAKSAITSKFKDPDSAKFRSLYISNKDVPTLCGEVNAKNSYGAYVGYRGFIYNEAGQFLDDGKELGEGFMYRSMLPTSCSAKFVDVSEP